MLGNFLNLSFPSFKVETASQSCCGRVQLLNPSILVPGLIPLAAMTGVQGVFCLKRLHSDGFILIKKEKEKE